MVRKNQNITMIFSQALRIGLLSKYKKIPSSGFVAKEFNLRAKGTSTITSETARRWLNGLVIPDLEKLIALSEWLEIDLNTLLSVRKASENNELNLAHEDIREFIHAAEKLLTSVHDISENLDDTIRKIKKINNQQ